MAIVSLGEYHATAPTLTEGQHEKLQLDVRGHLKTTDGFSTSSITYYPAAALTWTAVTPDPASSKLTIQNAAADKYTLIATEYIHKAQDGTLPLTQAPPFSAGATLYAGAIEMQLDLNTHVASTALHKVAGLPTYPIHKIPDATNPEDGGDAVNDSTNVYTLANAMIDDLIAHIASTTHHVTATSTITHTDATTEVTATTLVNLIRTSMISHLGQTALHGQVADTVNGALTSATTAATNAATNKTLINLLRAYYNAHCALGGPATNEATVVAQSNAVRTGMLSHLANVTTYHQTADTVNLALVSATTISTNAATALTLMNDLATPYYAHLAFYQRMKYAAASTIEWYGQTPLYVAIESAGGFTVLTES